MQHPGGSIHIGISTNRDATALVNSYHLNTAKVKSVLKKYYLRPAVTEDIHADMDMPAYGLDRIFGMNAQRDVPKFEYGFNAFHEVASRKVYGNKRLVKNIVMADMAFDFIVYLALIAWIPLVLYSHKLPFLVSTLLFVILKQIFCAAGHFGVHRKGASFFGSLFDTTNGTIALVEYDSHVAMHHNYLQSKCDPKRVVLKLLGDAPRLYRPFIIMAKKFLNFLGGYSYSNYQLLAYDYPYRIDTRTFVQLCINTVVTRLLMYIEFVYMVYNGQALIWFTQYLL